MNESIWQNGKYKITTDNLNCTFLKITNKCVKGKETKEDLDELTYKKVRKYRGFKVLSKL